MDIQAVAEELAAKGDAIAGMSTFAYPVDKPPLPCLVVVLPDEVVYHETYGGLAKEMVPLFVFVPRTNEKAAAEALAAYLSPTGARSIKATLDSKSNAYTSCDVVTITRAETGAYTYNGMDVYGAEFTAEIIGS